jgi:hypothetical protein
LQVGRVNPIYKLHFEDGAIGQGELLSGGQLLVSGYGADMLSVQADGKVLPKGLPGELKALGAVFFEGIGLFGHEAVSPQTLRDLATSRVETTIRYIEMRYITRPDGLRIK